MKLFDKYFDKVQAALSEGMSVFATTADGVSEIYIKPILDDKSEFLKGWNVYLRIDEESTADDRDILAISPVILYSTKDTSMDSMFAVTVIFLSLAKSRTIDMNE